MKQNKHFLSNLYVLRLCNGGKKCSKIKLKGCRKYKISNIEENSFIKVAQLPESAACIHKYMHQGDFYPFCLIFGIFVALKTYK